MNDFSIHRFPSTPEGVFGVFKYKQYPFALTLEDPWIDNKPFFSCIPCGDYKCVRVQSAHFGNTFTIIKVTDRTLIRFHCGNDADDTEGCVLIGEQYEILNNKRSILASRKGFSEFMSLTKNINWFWISINWI